MIQEQQSLAIHNITGNGPCFDNGKRNGYGTNYFPSGERYVGYWKNGKRNGKGTNYWPDGNKYEGNFKNDKRDHNGVNMIKISRLIL